MKTGKEAKLSPIREACSMIGPLDKEIARKCREKWSSLALPLGSLGLLQETVVKICSMTGSLEPSIKKRCVVVFCADNGVVSEGVTQTGSEVTAIVAKNLCTGDTSVCKMARVAKADVIPVDMGMNLPIDDVGIILKRLGNGTKNMVKEPAMARKTAEDGIMAGIYLAGKLKKEGYGLLAAGEMGIGNTTTSSAVASVLLAQPIERMTGVGAGLSSQGLIRKIKAIEAAIEKNRPDKNDPLDVISKVGGFDIAAMTGLFLGGAIHRVPVLIDGFISSVAALCAMRLCPDAGDFMLASHVSGEPAGALLLEALGQKSFISAGMRLGEGTGAVAAMPIIDMAFSVYSSMCTFEETNIEAYKPLS
jgi:nicotinate-nucleotide--dimethylbenzimidazole phosphoribosyltransferase